MKKGKEIEMFYVAYGFEMNLTPEAKAAVEEFFQDARNAGHVPSIDCDACVETVHDLTRMFA